MPEKDLQIPDSVKIGKMNEKEKKNMLYPILTESRFLSDLSGVWDFKLDDGKGFDEKWYASKMTDAMTMPVPASYNDLKEGVDFRDHYGWVFYQRNISVPSLILSQRLMLRCAAVTHHAKVYLNGEPICEHKGGFLPFEVEITDKMQPGDNLLTIAVDNVIDYSTLPVGGKADMMGGMMGGAMGASDDGDKKPQNNPNFDFFNYAGIIRPVRLYTTPKSYIEDVTIVPSINGEVNYSVKTQGEGTVAITILDQNGVAVAKAQGHDGTIQIDNPHLWEPWPGTPYLYTAQITFGEDMYNQTFGIRSIEVRGHQILINEKPFYLKGPAKHEDSYFHGRGLDQCLNVTDIDLFHWLGANAFRTSHYPYAEEMYQLCDREGIVIIDEVPAVGIGVGAHLNPYKTFPLADYHAKVLEDMINRDKNHPCVVMWSIGNEPDTENFPEDAYEYWHALYEQAHRQDQQNRPVTMVCCQNNYTKDITTRTMDVVCINRYYGWYNLSGDLESAEYAFDMELDFWQEIDKPVILSEYGADTINGLHGVVPEMFTEEFQVEYYKMMNRCLDQRDFVAGEMPWNFADFATQQGPMRVGGNRKGLFTRERRPKMAAHYFKHRWNNM